MTKTIAREKTALFRGRLSTPFQALLKHEFLQGEHSIFDFGCGRGDDLRLLEQGGIEASGWDPHYAPDEMIVSADVVNLGFVINVIENPSERNDVLQQAFKQCKSLLVVSVMLQGQGQYASVDDHGDGVLTSRNTFQKYYSQGEIKDLIEKVLGRQPVGVRPGCFFVFRNDADEQQFLEQRYHHRIEQHELLKWSLPADLSQRIYERNRKLLDSFWLRCLDLGRLPAPDELDEFEDLKEKVGGVRKSFSILSTEDRLQSLKESAARRKQDHLVFFALNFFEKRRSGVASTKRIDRDVKAFFGGRRIAQEEAKPLLMSVGDPGVMLKACMEADDASLGWFNEPRFFTFEISRLNRLPTPLRIYVGCASQLFGGLDEHDLLKVHVDSGKLTAMRFDDYHGKKIPMMVERIKVDMRSMDVHFFESNGQEYQPQPLYFKSRYMSPFESDFDEQYEIDQFVEGLEGIEDFGEYGPPLVALRTLISRSKNSTPANIVLELQDI
jgi:DNA phosphorothioation-associated putative methyltransferase